MRRVHASAPGRVCLFGEHCDYLGLPVIAAAIDLRMEVRGEERLTGGWEIRKPDIEARDAFPLGSGEVAYAHGGAEDFLRSAVNVLRRRGVSLPAHASFTLRGAVPVRAGTSSSSALQVAWLTALLDLAKDSRAHDRAAIAQLAYESEVLEFKGSGGMMDQFSCALGGLVLIEPDRQGEATALPANLGTFVLGHSLEPKDTQAVLSRLQAAARSGAARLRERLGQFHFMTTPLAEAEEAAQGEDLAVTFGALRNRDLCREGAALLREANVDDQRLGTLLNEHHAVLRDALEISTPKIERMLNAAISAGAMGGKINGSGGGGCMFAYAPHDAEAVAEAIRGEGGEAWVVRIATGAEVHPDE